MRAKQGRWLAALVIAGGLLAPGSAGADTIVGAAFAECDPNCPRGFYSVLHYWMPGLYRLLYECHPANLDQFPPGPCPPVPPSFRVERFPCPYAPPAPTAPYADPAGYFGRPTLEEERQATGQRAPGDVEGRTGPGIR
jgi:hypothetical protein